MYSHPRTERTVALLRDSLNHFIIPVINQERVTDSQWRFPLLERALLTVYVRIVLSVNVSQAVVPSTTFLEWMIL